MEDIWEQKTSSFSSKIRTSEWGEHRHENDWDEREQEDKTVEVKGFRELTGEHTSG